MRAERDIGLTKETRQEAGKRGTFTQLNPKNNSKLYHILRWVANLMIVCVIPGQTSVT